MNPDQMKEMMERAQKMQSEIESLQAQLATRRFDASAGGGMVTATVSGALRVLSIEIEPSLVADGDRGMIQDLSAAAVNAALQKAQETVSQEMAKMQSGLLANLPGMPGAKG